MPVYKIHNQYRYFDKETPAVTGHWVKAKTEERALSIAKKYEIAYPFGRKCKRKIIKGYPMSEFLSIVRNLKGNVWLEMDGELTGFSFSKGKITNHDIKPAIEKDLGIIETKRKAVELVNWLLQHEWGEEYYNIKVEGSDRKIKSIHIERMEK